MTSPKTSKPTSFLSCSRDSARILLLICAAALSLPATAQWKGRGEAGVALASGNSDTETANARIAVAYKSDDWENSATLAGNYVRNDDVTTAQRWEVGLQTRYTYSGRTFWYGATRYEQDRFGGFDYQGVVSTGVGRKFIDKDETHLTAQTGLGYKFFEITPAAPLPAERNGEVGGVLNVDFDHKLTATTTLHNKLGAEFSADNTFAQNEIGITVKMTDRLALAVAYAVRHNTKPPDGFRKTDTLTTLNLVYEVK